MQRRVLAVIAFLLLAVVATVVWRSFRAAAADPESTVAPAEDRPTARVDRNAGAELERPAVTPAQAPTPTRAEPEAASVDASVADQRALAAQGAIEFVLDVTWPEGVPADERAFLVVRGPKDADLVARLPFERGGLLSVWLPKEHKKGKVELEARYLYLDGSLRLDPDKRSKHIECAPKVGAWLRGHVVLPAGAALAELANARVIRNGWRMQGEGVRSTSNDAQTISADGTFEFGGVSPEMRHWVRLDVPAFVPFEHTYETVEAGRALDVSIELAAGVGFFGRVVDEAGAPIANAVIGVRIEREGWTDSADHSASSAADGTFALRGIEPEKLELTVQSPGRLEYRSSPRVYVEGEVVRELVITLERGNVLAGTVRWADGRAAEGAAIQVVDHSEEDDDSIVVLGATPAAKTDAQGAFEITGLGAGPFDVTATLTEVLKKEGKKRERKPWRATLESLAPNTRELVLVLEAPRALVGTVLDDLGEPVPKFTVSARPLDADGDPEWTKRVSTLVKDESGAFRLEKLHPGTWEVSAEAPGFQDSDEQRVVVEDGEVTVELVCVRAAKLTGLVLAPDGKPIAGARVAVRIDEGDDRWRGSSSCTTNSDGEFECTKVATGKLLAWATHGTHAPSEPQELELAPGDGLAGLTFHLRVGGRVEVEVLSPEGTEKSGHSVNLSTVGEDSFDVGGNYATTDEDGRAVLERVAPGTYMAHVWRDGRTSGSEDSAQVTVVDGGTVSVVLGRASTLAVRVTGRVTAGGEPVADADVSFSRNREDDWQNVSATTAADGRYELALEAGGAWEASCDADGTRVHAEVELPASGVFVHDFALGAAELAGTVLTPAGKPAPDVDIALIRLGANGEREHMGWVSADGRGRFEFQHVDAGRYVLETWNEDDAGPGLARGRRAPFDVAPAARLTGLDVVLTPSAKLTVRVTGVPPGVECWAGVTDTDGAHLRSERLEAPERQHAFEPLPAGRVRAWARAEGLRGAPVEVELTAGSERTVEIELVPVAKVLVRLVDRNGQAINGHVSLVRDGGQPSVSPGDPRAEHGFEDLLAGSYVATATNAAGAKGERSFSIAAGETKTLELVLDD
ncbi:MAG: carboxypeptidase regulatory-like domain-containing protein [Planctomycetes bacterium]|nr:carboxypeptidase regulatory-like domain-containing protein [Planctomycetota bacterium]